LRQAGTSSGEISRLLFLTDEWHLLYFILWGTIECSACVESTDHRSEFEFSGKRDVHSRLLQMIWFDVRFVTIA
jgi:hypothetical protein